MPRAKLSEATPVTNEAPAQTGRASLADATPISNSQSTEKQGFLSSAAESSGLTGLGNAIAHPIETMKTFGPSLLHEGKRSYDRMQSLKGANFPLGEGMKQMEYSLPFVGPYLEKVDTQQHSGNLPGAIGTGVGLIGSLVAPEVASEGISRMATPMKNAGAGLINRTAGMLKNDFARGANPGMAYLEGGGKPALTMSGLANQASGVRNATGEALSSAYENAGQRGVRIPATDVLEAVDRPISKLRTLQEGPGGVGTSPAIEEYESRLYPPIAKAEAEGGFTPRGLFENVKRPIAENTRWNDPTMFDLNKVRQQTVGGVGGLLTKAVPETESLNKIYQGTTNLAKRAESRASTGTPTLRNVAHRTGEGIVGAALGYATHNPLLAVLPLAADSVPVKTATGYTLFKAGQAAPSMSKLINGPVGRASLFPARRSENEQ